MDWRINKQFCTICELYHDCFAFMHCLYNDHISERFTAYLAHISSTWLICLIVCTYLTRSQCLRNYAGDFSPSLFNRSWYESHNAHSTLSVNQQFKAYCVLQTSSIHKIQLTFYELFCEFRCYSLIHFWLSGARSWKLRIISQGSCAQVQDTRTAKDTHCRNRGYSSFHVVSRTNSPRAR